MADNRKLEEAFSRDQQGQAAQNNAANAVNKAQNSERESRFNRPSTGQSGSFKQPGRGGK